jgi:capsular exopolysaccharide synthesis family protein
LELKEITDRQVLLFTSSSAGEGKTFCAVNCGVAMAQQGYKTLIIDTDLRHPSVGKRLGLAPSQPGLTDCLSGSTTPAKAYASTSVPQLFVLTAGTPVSNCAELMSSGRLAEMLGDEVFFSYFDRIIFDTAPVNAVSDALQFVRHATAVCLVIKAGKTNVAAAQRAQGSLLGVGGKDLGIVLNHVAATRYNPYGYDFRNATSLAQAGKVQPAA